MNHYTENILYRIALTQIDGIGNISARNLIDALGDEAQIFKASKKILSSVKGISENLASKILDRNVLRRAETELAFVEKNKIDIFFYTENNYPFRLKECPDAPILLYHKGKTNLNAKKIISIVGTRKSTDYGHDFCYSFLQELSLFYPDMLIVSGLAYGIDIHAHRAALKYGLPTTGVLAHGLDRIYPAAHRKTAVEMLENGGLLTEFPSQTDPDKFNFVRRNRIVAGLSDAVIVIQTDRKGGSLITADMANGYNREVFALPGRVTDLTSLGCNMLIEQNKAALLQSVEGFMKQMQWEVSDKKTEQKRIFIDLTETEQIVHDLLANADSFHINFISNQTGIAMSTLLPILLAMEMKEVIKPLPGGFYKLIKS